MAQIITCPRCGKLERYKGAGHVQCTFCKSPLGSLSELASDPANAPTNQANTIVAMTLYGALWGGGIAGLISVAFHGHTLFVLLALLSAPQQLDAAPSPDLAGFVMRLFLLPAAIGVAEGALLIALAGTALHRHPMLFWVATIGAAAGALLGAAMVLSAIGLAMLFGATFATGLNHFALWLTCIVAAAIGAPLGMLGLTLLRAINIDLRRAN